jgi:hypothetical protein
VAGHGEALVGNMAGLLRSEVYVRGRHLDRLRRAADGRLAAGSNGDRRSRGRNVPLRIDAGHWSSGAALSPAERRCFASMRKAAAGGWNIYAMGEPDVELRLSGDEALVLHDWLSRFNESDPHFDDQAEQRVLWNLEALLEKYLAAPLAPDYAESIAGAAIVCATRTSSFRFCPKAAVSIGSSAIPGRPAAMPSRMLGVGLRADPSQLRLC